MSMRLSANRGLLVLVLTAALSQNALSSTIQVVEPSRWQAPSVATGVRDEIIRQALTAVFNHLVPTADEKLTPLEKLEKTDVLYDLVQKQVMFAHAVRELRASLAHRKVNHDPQWTAMKTARAEYYESWDCASRKLSFLDVAARSRAFFGFLRE